METAIGAVGMLGEVKGVVFAGRGWADLETLLADGDLWHSNCDFEKLI